ncbi:MAG: ABC transporter permease [Planctomycetota bacterium]|nr:ABC transporter permease [Planctomycetota bacterium]
MRGTGARIGVAYIALLVLAAVFAPFLANSHPLLMKQAGAQGGAQTGAWSSPLLRHLTPADVVLLVMFFAVLGVALARRLSGAKRLLILAAVLAVSSPLAWWAVRPPAQVIYDKYRTGLADKSVEQAYFVPIAFSPDDRLRDQPDIRLGAPSAEHLMGTTNNGADLAANMIYASRIALSIGFIATGIAMVIGVVLGALMGYYSGWVDLLGMRLVEIFSAIPTLLLLLCFVAFFEPNLYIMMVILGVTGWTGDAVFVRAEFLRLREQDFVQAARACGIPLWSILFRHILPNGITPVLVNASFGVAGAILTESTLSFLGIGLVNDTSWGQLLNQALGSGGTFYWWIALYPGLAIFLTVFAYNLIGEALRDAFDPHAAKRGA